MTTAIKIENLSKKYVIGHQKQEKYTALRDVMAHKIRGIGRILRHPLSQNTKKTYLEEFWALKDINLEIKQGDRVGIIGRNGAGKSTLLKVLSRITEPTSGRIIINGRVASLLEVGTGFHPELTGRENIYLNGAILGMGRNEIKRKFDEIVDFSGVEKFLDTPVKRYSSGMYVRLAFAVAAHLEPEILIVDEVLAVGDATFQKKCLGKMKEVGSEGRTVLFVSHNMGAIKTLCSNCFVLDYGMLSFTGAVDEAMVHYNTSNRNNTGCHYKLDKVSVRQNEGKAQVLEAYATGKDGNICFEHFVTNNVQLYCKWQLLKDVPCLRFGIMVTNAMGITVLMSVDTDSTNLHGVPRQAGVYTELVTLPAFLIIPGTYSVSFFAGTPGVERWLDEPDLLQFEIVEFNTHLSNVSSEIRPGFSATPLRWEVECLND